MKIEDGEFLLRLGRAALTLWLEEGLTTAPPDDLPDEVQIRRGMWMSLYGYPHRMHRASVGVLHDPPAIVEAAINASILLARPETGGTPQITVADLAASTLELSITSKPTPLALDDATEMVTRIVPGRHGVIMEDEQRRVILPPHIVVTTPPTMPRFLDRICERCGLDPEFWRHPDTVVATFTIEVFAELWPVGEIVHRDVLEAGEQA
ncbi:MAG TPA: AMMECR1 domain-containing protein [bacterium]